MENNPSIKPLKHYLVHIVYYIENTNPWDTSPIRHISVNHFFHKLAKAKQEIRWRLTHKNKNEKIVAAWIEKWDNEFKRRTGIPFHECYYDVLGFEKKSKLKLPVEKKGKTK